MNYKFVIDYTPTDPAGEASQRVCSPTYGDDLSVNIEMESDEWYRKRKMEGKLTFLREDYGWIMGQPFDGTFKLTVQSSNDGGATWQNYLEGTFSRANLEIDEDNQNVVLNGLNEGGEYNVIENGKSEEYDLMKIIPDGDAKEVQGQVHPALAIIDNSSSSINTSDMYCNYVSFVGPGYKAGERGHNDYLIVEDTISSHLTQIYAEAQVVMRDHSSPWSGIYSSPNDSIIYERHYSQDEQYSVLAPAGSLRNDNYGWIIFSFGLSPTIIGERNKIYITLSVYDNNGVLVPGATAVMEVGENTTGEYAPSSIVISSSNTSFPIEKITIHFHYICLSVLYGYYDASTMVSNFFDTANYYKGVKAYNGAGLTFQMSRRTTEAPNGHRLVPGTGEQGTVPQYFAPPDETNHWIPLSENNWNYASMWYTITPSETNDLFDPTKVGSFRWARCWTLGTCLDRLLRKITNNKVTFDQSEVGSQFLYAAVNPLTQGEPFEYLFTQKSNVMRPSLGGEGASRCPVRLEWFLEFMRNALNCYWWLEERNGGTYAFRVEHVEWFRRGGSYTGQMDAQFNLTEIKTRRNFLRNGEAAKRLDDQLHKYSYEMNGMTEKYTFSWQGDGGSDDFKGNPMFFKAGWVEKGTSESHEVDNVFADLSWLMLNAGTDTASSKNYDGIFVFSGYRADGTLNWRENKAPIMRYPQLASGSHIVALYDIWLTVPEGDVINVTLRNTDTMTDRTITSITGTGRPQVLRLEVDEMYISGSRVLFVDFGGDWQQVVVHRVHALTGNVYNVPNVLNRLSEPTEPGYLQNGALAWPWLQCEFLHYDVPAQRWGYKYDDLDALDSHNAWEADGTVKLRKKQEVPLLPLPTKNDEEDLDKGVIGGLKDSQGQLQTGIVKSASINLGTRNATLTLMYDMIS